MTTFTAIMEVYKDNEIKYVPIEFIGGSLSLPKQDDMADREYIIEQVQRMVDFEVIDLTGIVQDNKIIWGD